MIIGPGATWYIISPASARLAPDRGGGVHYQLSILMPGLVVASAGWGGKSRQAFALFHSTYAIIPISNLSLVERYQ